jgi:hemerythrin
MQPFKWSRAHEVFLPEIDAEHRILFRDGAELYKAVLGGAAPESVGSMLQSLLAAAEEHFRHEERLMRSTGFPSRAWHKQQHDAVRRRAGECLERVAEGDAEARIELLRFLSGWLHDHTAVADRMMGAYLRNAQRRVTALAS